jgi:hypothetical protein
MSDSISFYSYPGIIPVNKKITFEIPFDEIASSSQKRKYVEPRQIIQALANILTSEGQPKIGMRFRGRDGEYKDHSTVLNSKIKFYEHYETEREYRVTVRKLLVRIGVNGTYFDKKVKNYNTEKDEGITGMLII